MPNAIAATKEFRNNYAEEKRPKDQRWRAHSKCCRLDSKCQPQVGVVREGLVKGLIQPERMDSVKMNVGNSMNCKIQVALES